MGYKRIFVRVPIEGYACLSAGSIGKIKARTIDISFGGIGIISPSEKLPPTEYQIEVTTERGEYIRLNAELIRQNEKSAGFQITHLDNEHREIIARLVEEFQTTDEFIKQLDEHDLFAQHFVDEEGNQFDISFEAMPGKGDD